MKHKVESRLPGEISITSYMQTTPLLWQKVKRNFQKVKSLPDESERGEWKSWLKTQHSGISWHPVPSLLASSPITYGKYMGKKWKQWQTIFLGSKITADGDCSHEMKRCLLPGRKAMTNLDSILKSRDITLPKVHLVKAMVFPVVMYGCESWTIKKAEHRRIDAFELWCWRRLLRVLGLQGDPTSPS